MENTVQNQRIKQLLSLIALLMLADYLLTYIGIHGFECITEANPFMQNFMELPFYIGFPLRIVLIMLPIQLLKIAYNYISNKKIFYNILRVLLLIEMIPIAFHFIWISRYTEIIR